MAHLLRRCSASCIKLPCQWPFMLTCTLQNLKRHAHHYSFLGPLGPGVMTAVAERLGAGVYFNTLVPWRPHQVNRRLRAGRGST